MPRVDGIRLMAGLVFCLAMISVRSPAAPAEYNPMRRSPVSIGPEAHRLIVGFRATSSNGVEQTVRISRRARSYTVNQAQTTTADVQALARRAGLNLARSRQFTPSMHVMFLQKTLYGAGLEAALDKLRADPAVQFAAVDQRRHALLTPTNPLFGPTPGVASGQWYLNTPGPATVEGQATTDWAATDAVSAWNITTGSPGVVIADVDTGVLFDHPDLLRAGLGGRLLPGYDFIGEDYNPNSPYNALGTFDIANDYDGWDPDPSDPGDWISQADIDNPNQLFAGETVSDSSWHGTRVVGVFGSITNNSVGTAGMSWGSPSQPGPWVLPVRALGKGGGYDSDIIAGIQWAAGMTVTNPDGSAVPVNPYPADIVNLSLGGDTTSCTSSNGMAYESALTTVTGMGVVVVVSAGNGGQAGQPAAGVDLPANCSAAVPGVIAVAGLRNVGTKVGYSSIGPEVSVSAPAGNCINSSGACLRSIDTTTDTGTTGPVAGSGYTYTNETNVNLGTSFSAPIVSGIAALMRSVNNNLTAPQLAARLKASVNAFPADPTGVPTCPTLSSSGECSCLGSNQCGTGMVNAYHAVQAAQQPIAAVALPVIAQGSNAVLDAGGSAASCGRSIAAYDWAVTAGTVTIIAGATGPRATILPGTGTVTLTVTDNVGGTDTATITIASSSASSTAPAKAGTSAGACPTAITVAPAAPTVGQMFSPAAVGQGIPSVLTFTLNNANAYTLTQTSFSDTLPAGLTIAGSPAPTTTCTGANGSLTTSSNSITLNGGNIPPKGGCTVTVSVAASALGTYTNTVAANALITGPAGANTASSAASLSVTAPKPPTVTEAFSPASIGQNGSATLTITFSNPNAYALASAHFSETLPSNLTVKSSPQAATTCNGALSAAGGSVTLSGALIPASGSCSIMLTVGSGSVGSYTNTIAASALTAVPASANAAGATASLSVTASSGGGGAVDWLDITFVAGVLLAGRRGAGRRGAGRRQPER